METVFTMDPRRIPALVRRLRVPQGELAKRAGVRPDDVSRFFCALAPGGLMDRLIDAVTSVAAETDPRS